MYSLYHLEKHIEHKQQEFHKIAETERLARFIRTQEKRLVAKTEKQMKRSQLIKLFVANLSILFVGMGLFPLLPIYAGRYGATPAMIGVYLAFVYISISLGSMLAGWLSGKVSRKVLLVAAGLGGTAALALVGQAATFWQVAILTGALWFSGGIGLAVFSVLASLQAGEEERGKWFSLIALATPLGAIIGGLVVGRLVEWFGYPAMFAAIAVVYAVWPALSLVSLDYKTVVAPKKEKTVQKATLQPSSRFNLLMLAALLAAATVSVIRIGVSLSMEANSFSASAIAETNVIAGLVTIPLVFWLGTLSDKTGRKLFLSGGYLLAAIGGLTLITSHQLWHYWLISTLILVARTINTSMTNAIASDILDPEIVGRRLPQLNTMQWVAGVIGFAGSGYIMENLGEAGLYIIAVVLSLGAAVLIGLLPIHARSSQAEKGWTLQQMMVQEKPDCS
jgi:MFS family permease